MSSIADFVGALSEEGEGARKSFPLMPEGEAFDMGHAPDGTPLLDPRILDSPEFFRNPYPYYRIMRDHYPVFHDKLHNCYWVTRYDDITECYFDDEGFNTIPKGSSSGVLGNTQLELSGVEHRRRRNLYGQHLVGQSLKNRIPAIERLAAEMIADWDSAADSASHLGGKAGCAPSSSAECSPTNFRFEWSVKCSAFPRRRRRISTTGTTR